jgi:hypothetical protein
VVSDSEAGHGNDGAFGRSSVTSSRGDFGGSFAASGGGAVQSERCLGGPLGSTLQPDGRRGSSTEGRQEPLTVGAACGLAVGFDHRGTGPDAGSDRTAAVGRSWPEDFRGCGSSLLQTARHHLQKKRCTPPNKIGPTCPWLANAGRLVRQALTPPSWCLLTRQVPTPRWSASTDDVEGASDSSARPRGVIGRPQPSPVAYAATVWSRPGSWKVP